MTDSLLHFPWRGSHPDEAAAPERQSLEPRPEQIAEALRNGKCPADWAFDFFLTGPMRALSSQYWTPLAVAARAAEWFDECGVRTVLDIGSGAGKFCVAAALAGHSHFAGVEHRGRLVAEARALARIFKVESRVHFLAGAVGDVPVPRVDAYYLYNPFEENVVGYAGRIDDDVELSQERLGRDTGVVRELLIGARAGTYVLIYNGFSGNLPTSYSEVRTDGTLPNVLRLWRKCEPRAIRRVTGSYGARDGDGFEGIAVGASEAPATPLALQRSP